MCFFLDYLKNINNSLEYNLKRLTYLPIFSKIDEMANIVYGKLSSFNLETIEDLEVLHQYIISVRSLLQSDRYGLNGVFSGISYSCNNDPQYFSYKIENNIYQSSFDIIIKRMERVNRKLSKL